MENSSQTKQNPLANIKYDAFISYKHESLDMKVVNQLQKYLEHFHVHRRSGSAKKHISRVFVDNGELSSSFGFADHIRTALSNSEWLIVVCSSKTRNSPWVNKEIRTFLETHDIDHILVVLLEGEPDEVFPEALLDADGKANSVRAADSRGDSEQAILKKLKKSALYDLAAPILDIDKESLIQRRRTYVMQRVALALACIIVVLMAFSSYIFYQSQQIKKQYKETLLREAKLLSNQSQDLMESGERKYALITALSALEKSPDLPAAHLALEQAVLPYAVNSATDIYPKSTLDLSSPASKCYAVDQENQIFALMDTQRQIYYFDMDTESLLSIFTPDMTAESAYHDSQIYFLEDHTSIIYDKTTVYCFDYLNDQLKWQFSAGDSVFEDTKTEITNYSNIVPICHEEKNLLYIARTGINDHTDDKYLLLFSIDLSNGQVMDASTFESGIHGSPAFWDINMGGDQIALGFNGNYSDPSAAIILCDPASDTISGFHTKHRNLSTLAYTSDQQLCYLTRDMDPLLDIWYTDSAYEVALYDCKNQEVMWTYDDHCIQKEAERPSEIFVTYSTQNTSQLDQTQGQDTGLSDIGGLPVDDTPMASVHAALPSDTNPLQATPKTIAPTYITIRHTASEILNLTYDGRLLSKYTLGQPIIGASRSSSSEYMLMASGDGYIYRTNKSYPELLNTKYGRQSSGINNLITFVYMNQSQKMILVSESDKKIYIYGFAQEQEDRIISDSISGIVISPDERYYLSRNMLDKVTELRDMETDEVRFSISDSTGNSITTYGFVGEYCYYVSGNELHRYHIEEDREASVWTYTKDPESVFAKSMFDTDISSYMDSDGQWHLLLANSHNYLDLKAEDMTETCMFSGSWIEARFRQELGCQSEYLFTDPAVSESCQGHYLILNYSRQEGKQLIRHSLLVNFEDQTTRPLPDMKISSNGIGWVFSGDQTLLFTPDDTHQIHVIDAATLEETGLILPEGSSYYRALFTSPDNRYVFIQTEDYHLLTYDMDKARFVSDIETDSLTVSDPMFSKDQSLLMMNFTSGVSYTGYTFYKERLPGQFEKYSDPGAKYVSSHYVFVNAMMGSTYKLPIKTTDELIDMANQLLDGTELTDAEKFRLGIE